jgi:poly-gamma-glutamate synthesis protein (capsule biosynthesis protein)
MSDALKLLQESDITFGNLEGPLTDGGEPNSEKYAAIRQNPSLLMEYERMGFKILHLANNHMLDYGRVGLINTLKTLREAGLQYVGAGEDIDEALKVAYLERKGVRVAFLGCASTLPGDSEAGPNKPGLAPIRVRTSYHIHPGEEKENPGTPPVVLTEPNEEDLERVTAVIHKAKAKADFVIVSIHWGMPRQDSIEDYQPVVGRAFIDAGANLVVGHHAHRVHAVHQYKNGFIFYSIGDFFFEFSDRPKPKDTKWQYWPPKLGMWSVSNQAVIVRTKITRSGGAIHELVPTVKPKGGRPQILKGSSAEHLLRHIEDLSSGEAKFSIKDGRATIRS